MTLTTLSSSDLLHRAALELEEMRGGEFQSNIDQMPSSISSKSYSTSSRSSSSSSLHSKSAPFFPPACRMLLQSIEGNRRCVDCSDPNPVWASVTYGTLLCMTCCGRHRSYGVQTSFTRSLDMDSWSHQQVLTMLEGGNVQLQQFFHRHQLGTTISNDNSHSRQRYHTKAAKFYKVNLTRHVQAVGDKGTYQGRDENRPRKTSANGSQSVEHIHEDNLQMSISNDDDYRHVSLKNNHSSIVSTNPATTISNSTMCSVGA